MKKYAALRPDIKFIFISGYTADIILQKGIVEEGVEFVTKPFSKNEILRKVRNVLDRRRSIDCQATIASDCLLVI